MAARATAGRGRRHCGGGPAMSAARIMDSARPTWPHHFHPRPRRGDRCHFRKKLYLANGAGEQRLPRQAIDAKSPGDFLRKNGSRISTGSGRAAVITASSSESESLSGMAASLQSCGKWARLESHRAMNSPPLPLARGFFLFIQPKFGFNGFQAAGSAGLALSSSWIHSVSSSIGIPTHR